MLLVIEMLIGRRADVAQRRVTSSSIIERFDVEEKVNLRLFACPLFRGRVSQNKDKAANPCLQLHEWIVCFNPVWHYAAFKLARFLRSGFLAKLPVLLLEPHQPAGAGCGSDNLRESTSAVDRRQCG
jgi:hypothetical protein